ncbi:hypothetical protein ACFL3M_00925 [Patescibacteria group bacterium]
MNTHKNCYIWIAVAVAVIAMVAIIATNVSFTDNKSVNLVPISSTKDGEVMETYNINEYESEIEGTDLLDKKIDFESDSLELQENDAEIKVIDESVKFDLVNESETSL